MLGRINLKNSDVHREDALYHQMYSVNFRTGREIPQKLCGQEEVSEVPQPKKRKGRPYDSARKTLSKKRFGAMPTVKNLYLWRSF